MSASQARMLDLFSEGAVAAVEKGDERLVVGWVNKLNAFEKEDVERAARGARAKRMLEWERSDDDQAVFELETSEWSDDVIAEAIISDSSMKHYVEAVEHIRTLEEWEERLAYLAEVDQLGVTGPDASEEDRALYEKVTAEYAEITTKLFEKLKTEQKADLLEGGREKLLADYRARYRAAEGMRAGMQESRVAEVFYCTRECRGVWKDDHFEHPRCNHALRLFPSRGAVREMPEQAFFAVTAVLESFNMSYDDAGNSAAPTGSSEPSEQPSKPEESTPSTPVETSTAQAGT